MGDTAFYNRDKVSQMADVDMSGFSAGKYVKWDGTNFVAATAPITTFAGLSDVNLGGITNGEVVKWDSGTSRFVGSGANFKILATGITVGEIVGLYFTPGLNANYGNVNVGGAPFDGTTGGFFVGSAQGTHIAINAWTAFTGSFFDFQIQGASKALLDYTGKLTVVNLKVTTTPTSGYVLTSDASGNATWQAVGAGGGAVTSFNTRTGAVTLSLADVNGVLNVSPTASATTSLIQVGPKPFDGTTSGFFTSANANGVYVGINANTGYTGYFADYQVNGVTKYAVTKAGGVQTPTCYWGPGSDLPAGDPFLGLGYTFIRDNSSLGIAIIPTHSMWVFMGSSASDRYNIATSGGTQKFSFDVNAAVPRFYTPSITMRLDGSVTSGSAIRLGWQATTNSPTTTTKIVSIGYNGAALSGVNNADNADTPYNEVAYVNAAGLIYSIGGYQANVAPPSVTTRGLVSLGAGPFDGTTSGFFAGSSSGTHFAVNGASAFVGNFLDLQLAGVARAKLDYTGKLTVVEIVATGRITANVFTLTDAATIATDASLGAEFTCSIAVDRTLGAPTNAVNGQRIVWRIKNTDSSAHALTLTTGAGGFRFGTDITGLTTIAAGKTDYIGAVYNSTDSRWDVVSYIKGF